MEEGNVNSMEAEKVHLMGSELGPTDSACSVAMAYGTVPGSLLVKLGVGLDWRTNSAQSQVQPDRISVLGLQGVVLYDA